MVTSIGGSVLGAALMVAVPTSGVRNAAVTPLRALGLTEADLIPPNVETDPLEQIQPAATAQLPHHVL